jgi:hypothetical protein
MNILTKTIIAAGAWLALASTTELTNIEAALVIAALVIFQTSGE